MARGDRSSKAADIGGLLLVGAVVYLLYGPVLPTFTWIVLAVAVVLLWISFVRFTGNNYDSRQAGTTVIIAEAEPHPTSTRVPWLDKAATTALKHPRR